MKLNFSIKLPTNDLGHITSETQAAQFGYNFAELESSNFLLEDLALEKRFMLDDQKLKFETVHQKQMEKIKSISVELSNELEATNLWIDCLKPDDFAVRNVGVRQLVDLRNTLEAEARQLKRIREEDLGLDRRDLDRMAKDQLVSKCLDMSKQIAVLNSELRVKQSQLENTWALESINAQLANDLGYFESEVVALRAVIERQSAALGEHPLLPGPLGQPARQPQQLQAIESGSLDEQVVELKLRIAQLEQSLVESDSLRRMLKVKLSENTALQHAASEANKQVVELKKKFDDNLVVIDSLNQKVTELKAKNDELFATVDKQSAKSKALKAHIAQIEKLLAESHKKNEELIKRLTTSDTVDNTGEEMMEETVERNEGSARSMQRRMAVLEQKNLVAKEALLVRDRELMALNQKLLGMGLEGDKLKAALQAERKQAMRLEEALGLEKLAKEDIAAKADALQAEVDSAGTKVAELANQVKFEGLKNQALQSQNDRLRAELAGAMERESAAVAKWQSADQLSQTLQAKLDKSVSERPLVSRQSTKSPNDQLPSDQSINSVKALEEASAKAKERLDEERQLRLKQQEANGKLRGELGAAKRDIESLEAQLKKAQLTQSNLHDAVADARCESDKLKLQVDKMAVQLQQQTKDKGELERQKGALARELAAAKRALVEGEGRIKQLEGVDGQRLSEMDKLGKELGAVGRRAEELEGQLQSAKTALAAKNNEAQQLLSLVDDLKGQLSRLTEALNAGAKKAETDLAALKRETQQQLRQAEQQVKDSQSQAKGKQAEAELLKQALEDLRKELEESRDKADRLGQQLLDLASKAQGGTVSEDTDRLQMDCHDAQARVQCLERELDEVRQQLERVREGTAHGDHTDPGSHPMLSLRTIGGNVEYEQLIDSRDKTVKELNNRIDELVTELNRLKSDPKVLQLEREVVNLQNQVGVLGSHLEDALSQLKEAQKRVLVLGSQSDKGSSIGMADHLAKVEQLKGQLTVANATIRGLSDKSAHERELKDLRDRMAAERLESNRANAKLQQELESLAVRMAEERKRFLEQWGGQGSQTIERKVERRVEGGQLGGDQDGEREGMQREWEERLRERDRQMDGEREGMQREWEGAVRERDRQMEALRKELREAKEEVSRAKAGPETEEGSHDRTEVEVLTTERLALSDQLGNAMRELLEALNSLSDSQLQLRQTKAKADDLSIQLERSSAANDQLSQALEDAKGRLANALSRNQALAAQLKALSTANQNESVKKVLSLEADKQDLTEQCNRLTDLAKSLAKDKELLEGFLEEKTGQVVEATVAVGKAQGQLEEWKRRAEVLEQEVNRLKGQLGSKGQAEEALKGTAERLRSLVGSLEDEVWKLQQRVGQLEAEGQGQERASGVLRAQVESLRGQLSMRSEDLRKERLLVADLRVLLATGGEEEKELETTGQSSNDDSWGVLTDRGNDVVDLSATVELLQGEVRSLADRLSEREETLWNEKTEKRRLIRNQRETEEQLSRLRAELQGVGQGSQQGNGRGRKEGESDRVDSRLKLLVDRIDALGKANSELSHLVAVKEHEALLGGQLMAKEVTVKEGLKNRLEESARAIGKLESEVARLQAELAGQALKAVRQGQLMAEKDSLVERLRKEVREALDRLAEQTVKANRLALEQMENSLKVEELESKCRTAEGKLARGGHRGGEKGTDDEALTRQSEVGKLEEQLRRSRQDNDDSNRLVEQLRHELSRLKNENSTSSLDCFNALQQLSELNAQLVLAQGLLGLSEERVKEVQTDMDNEQLRHAQTANKVGLLETEVVRLKDALGDMQSANEELKQKLLHLEHDTLNSVIGRADKESQDKLKEMDNKLREANGVVAALEGQARFFKGRNDELVREADQLMGEVREGRTREAQDSEAIRRLTAEGQRKDLALGLAEERLRQLTKRLEGGRRNLGGSQEVDQSAVLEEFYRTYLELGRARAALEKERQGREQAEGALEGVVGERDRLRQLLEDCKRQLEESQGKLGAVERANEDLARTLGVREAEKEFMLGQLEVKNSQIDRLLALGGALASGDSEGVVVVRRVEERSGVVRLGGGGSGKEGESEQLRVQLMSVQDELGRVKQLLALRESEVGMHQKYLEDLRKQFREHVTPAEGTGEGTRSIPATVLRNTTTETTHVVTIDQFGTVSPLDQSLAQSQADPANANKDRRSFRSAEDLETELQIARNNNKALQQELVELQGQVEEWRNKFISVDSTIEGKSQNIAFLNVMVETQKREVKELADKLKAARADLLAANGEVEVLRMKLKVTQDQSRSRSVSPNKQPEKSPEVETLKRKVGAMEKAVEALQAQKAERSAKAVELGEAVEDLQRQLEEKGLQVRELGEAVALGARKSEKLRGELDEALERLRKAGMANQAREAEVSALGQQLADLQAENAGLKNRVQGETRQKEALAAEVSGLQGQLDRERLQWADREGALAEAVRRLEKLDKRPSMTGQGWSDGVEERESTTRSTVRQQRVETVVQQGGNGSGLKESEEQRLVERVSAQETEVRALKASEARLAKEVAELKEKLLDFHVSQNNVRDMAQEEFPRLNFSMVDTPGSNANLLRAEIRVLKQELAGKSRRSVGGPELELLKASVGQLRQEVSEKDALLRDKQASLDELFRQAQELNAKLMKGASDWSALNGKVKGLENEVAGLVADKLGLEEELRKAKLGAGGLRQELEGLRNRLDDERKTAQPGQAQAQPIQAQPIQTQPGQAQPGLSGMTSGVERDGSGGRLRELEEELAQESTRNKAKVDQLTEQLRDQTTRLRELEGVGESLAAKDVELGGLRLEVERLRSQLDSLQSESLHTGVLINDFNAIKEGFVEQSTRVLELENVVSDQNALILKLKEQISKFNLMVQAFRESGLDPSDLAKLKETLAKQKSDLESLQLGLGERDRRIAALEEEVRACKRTLGEERDGMAAEREGAARQRAKDGAEIERLEREVSRLKGEVGELQSVVVDREGQIAGLKRALEESEGAAGQARKDWEVKVRALQREIDGLRQELVEKDEVIRVNQGKGEVERRLRAKEEEVAELQRKLREALNEVDGLRRRCEEAEEEGSRRVEAKERESRELRKRVGELERQLKEAGEEAVRVGQRVKEVESQLGAKEEELGEARRRTKSLADKLAAAEERADRLQGQLEAMEAKMGEDARKNQRVVDELHRQLAEMERRLGEVGDEKEYLVREAEELRAQLESANAGWAKEREAMRREIERLQGEVDALKDQLKKCESDLADRNARLAAMARESERQQEEFDTQLQEQKSLSARIQEKLKGQLDELGKLVDDARAKSVELERLLAERDRELAKLTRELKAKEAQLEQALERLRESEETDRRRGDSVAELKETDKRVIDSNMSLLDLIKRIGVSSVKLKQDVLVQSDNPERWFEQLRMDQKNQGMIIKELSTDVEYLLGRVKELEEQLREWAEKQQANPVTAELEELIESTNGTFEGVTSLQGVLLGETVSGRRDRRAQEFDSPDDAYLGMTALNKKNMQLTRQLMDLVRELLKDRDRLGQVESELLVMTRQVKESQQETSRVPGLEQRIRQLQSELSRLGGLESELAQAVEENDKLRRTAGRCQQVPVGGGAVEDLGESDEPRQRRG
jgi:chromosome segregation ATPase